jgi:hypothetical protein
VVAVLPVRAGTRSEYTIEKHEPRLATEPINKVPEVKISDSLVGAHAATRRLVGVLDGRESGNSTTAMRRCSGTAGERLHCDGRLYTCGIQRALQVLRHHARLAKVRMLSCESRAPRDFRQLQRFVGRRLHVTGI